ncbi:MAG TPA: bifunctional UDP-3-O-[3-hydroxymyristoyl] N-acetylglucosamine deacetylase/3-hydroxyacyl-ACP dehydratase [Candidatus Marinimicrobia bacterium]|nr:bifunctional UDP-3-O-[3-hydroxymyristoyl] N-acetylglucosamine deacetylase/3-hydroxyacyl-ACP dehydratase [Candidatus Neomarinimicrobiota bacterium]HRS52553.1 bifunctional UDP-3-O-[3-hydroxymyristoyl] N-acetylglucosamine deacetylase/3-hydroxyacyl-ACP dehydratase [Candidatus Neomarinimicrobiota bacterium]HRU93156.1 bifunctional UDP-3-O-[3-hydroxymyristoyl] N-acetylglucosamine deacetylase/3-hydroxyacyl-ACP dehydratase [Candidatus Neomarinimicrobiota bacterium]
MSRHQRTIKNEVSISGIGLHTGVKSTVTFKPAPENYWIRFVRTDVENCPEILADINHVTDISRGTTLSQNGVQVHTVEHVLSAVAGLGIDNIIIEINNIEPPVCDGSAIEFVRALKRAEIIEQEAEQEILVIDKILTYSDPKKHVDIHITPAEKFQITFLIDYSEIPAIGTQYSTTYSLEEEFETDYAAARTFCTLSEIEELKNRGLIKGGNVNNAVVFVDRHIEPGEIERLRELFGISSDISIGQGGTLNGVELRYYNEAVRHKIVDLIGDFALLGVPIQGHVIAARSGHAHNVNFVRKIRKEYEKVLISKKFQKSKVKGAIFDISGIERILPHRFPFLMVDKIIDMVPGESVTAIKNVSINEPFFQGHFPVKRIMPGVLVLECLAQAGGFMLLNTIENPEKILLYFTGLDEVRFRKPVVPGDQIRLEVKMVQSRLSVFKMRGVAFVNDEVVVEANMMASLVDL